MVWARPWDEEEGRGRSGSSADHEPRRDAGLDERGLEVPTLFGPGGFLGVVPCGLACSACEGPMVNGVIKRSCAPAWGGPNGPSTFPSSTRSRSRSRSRCRCVSPAVGGYISSLLPFQKADI